MGFQDLQKSGTPGSPMRYSTTGVRNCQTGGVACNFWRVESYFWATCPGGISSCDQAANINVRYIIRPEQAEFLGRPMTSMPPSTEFDTHKTRFAISHNISRGDMQIGGNQSCPVGALMSGMEENGRIKCECRGGFEQIGNTNPIVCRPLATMCNPGQRIKGRNPDGSVLCVNQRKICTTVNFSNDDGDTNANTATCPVGGWLEGINLGYCRAARRNKKGTTRGITCDNNRGTCCYFDER
jgi:hypothetical protein